LLKTRLLGGLEIMNEKIIPAIDNFVKRLKDEGWLNSITETAKMVGTILGTLAKFFINNPELTALVYGLSKLGGVLFDVYTWTKNGILLSRGFMMGMGRGGGLMGPSMPPAGGTSTPAGGTSIPAGGFKANLRSGPAIGAGLLSAGLYGYQEYQETGSAGRAATKGIGGGLGAWGGGAAGAAAGAALGTMLFPGLGTAAGTVLGGILGLAGAGLGGYLGAESADALGNYILPEANDGYFGAGSQYKRGIIQSGMITPINNKDDLIALKKNGVIDNAMSSGSSSQDVRHSFGDLRVGGEIMLRMPGAGTVGVDLMRDPSFIRELTQKINIEIEKMRNQIQKG
jgi:hypothetical protein